MDFSMLWIYLVFPFLLLYFETLLVSPSFPSSSSSSSCFPCDCLHLFLMCVTCVSWWTQLFCLCSLCLSLCLRLSSAFSSSQSSLLRLVLLLDFSSLIGLSVFYLPSMTISVFSVFPLNSSPPAFASVPVFGFSSLEHHIHLQHAS